MKRIVVFVLLAVGMGIFAFKWPLSHKQEEKGLTLEQFNNKVSNKEKIILVYFNADWCVPCIKLKPVMAQIEEEEKSKVVVLKLNVDDNPEIATHFEINTLPLFHIYRNGKVVWQYTGIQSKKELSEKISNFKY